MINDIIVGNGHNSPGYNSIYIYSTSINVVDADHNLYYGNQQNNVGLHSDASNVTGQDPLFVNPASGLFQLRAGSCAVDRGMIIPGYHCSTAGAHPDESLREWYGSAPDIGAYEVALSAITDLSVSGASQNSVSLAWTVPGGSTYRKPTQYDIRYANSPVAEASWDTARFS